MNDPFLYFYFKHSEENNNHKMFKILSLYFFSLDHILYSRCGNYVWVSGIYGHRSVDGKMQTIEDVTRNVLQHLQGEISSHSTVHRVRKQISTLAHSCFLFQDQHLWFN